MSTTEPVLTVDDRTGPVAAKDTLGGAVSIAYVADDGTVRSLDSDQPYSRNDFELLSPELSQPVVVNQQSHVNSYHTNMCRELKKVSVGRRHLITVDEARNFYDSYEKCTRCERYQELGIDDLQAIVNGEYNG